MANVAKIGGLVTKALKSSNARQLVYSTGGNRGIFFDAFKEFNSRPHMAKKLSKDIFAASGKVKANADAILKPICDDLGEFGSRLKKIPKINGKIPKAMSELTLDEFKEYLMLGKVTNLMGDGYGARIIINNPKDVPKLIKRLINLHNEGKIKISLVENYRGNNINPYINGNFLRQFEELSYKSIEGLERHVNVLNKVKKAGYTRANMDIFINGVKTEFQIGGKYTTRFGEVEHYLYDMRGFGNPDLSKLSSEQRQLFDLMKEKYILVAKNKKTDKIYNDYLSDIWNRLKNAEEKGLLFPELPDPTEGIPKILSIKNLFKLEH